MFQYLSASPWFLRSLRIALFGMKLLGYGLVCLLWWAASACSGMVLLTRYFYDAPEAAAHFYQFMMLLIMMAVSFHILAGLWPASLLFVLFARRR